VPLVFQTTFDNATFPDQHGRVGHHWESSDYLFDYPGPNNQPCVNGSCGISLFGGFFTTFGGPNQPTGDDAIIAAANNPGGGGGKGFRHWRGNAAGGQNDNGGGITIGLPSAAPEFWFRMYMRYQLGFTWGPFGVANPGYTKDLRNLSNNGWVFGIQGGASWGLEGGPANQFTRNSSRSWQQTMGAMTGDGLFHCYEFHYQAGNSSHLEMWVDNVKVLDTVVNTPPDMTQSIVVGSNQNAVGDVNGRSTSNGGTPTDWYTDYDDIAISTTGRIGCIGSLLLPPPRNLNVQ